MSGVAFLTAKLGPNARLIVEAAFGADLTASRTTWTWYDITTDVRQAEGQKITVTQGRQDETSTASPASCAFQLNNTSGAYSPYTPTSVYYPYVRRNTPIRVRVTVDGTTWFTRFFGFANGFTPSWDASAKQAIVSVSAAGMLRRLMQGNSPVKSPLRSAFSADSAIVAYWPLEDKGGTAGSGLAGGSAMNVNGTIKFADASDLTGSDAVATLTATSDLSGNVPNHFSGTQWQIDIYAKMPSTIAAGERVLFRLYVPDGHIVTWEYVFGAVSGVPYQAVHGYDSNGSLTVDSGHYALNSWQAGGWGHYGLSAQQDGGNTDWVMNISPVFGAGGAITGTVSGNTGKPSRAMIPASAGLDGTSVGHLAVWNAYNYDAGVLAGKGYGPDPQLGWPGETALYRMRRLCTENGIALQPLFDSGVEDFEDTTYLYSFSGTWARSTTHAYSGSWSLKSAAIADNGTTDVTFTVPKGARTMSFWLKVSTEYLYDPLLIYRDGVLAGSLSGEIDWFQELLDVTGVSSVLFRYTRDETGGSGDNAVYIDNVSFTNPAGMGPQSVDTFVNLMRECETADAGVLLDGLDNSLAYISNAARYNQAAAMTIDASAGQLADPPAPVDDDQRNRNLVKADRKDGSTATYQDTTGPLGTNAIGVYDSSLTINYDGDGGLLDRASWEVHRGTVEGLRYPSFGLNFASTPSLAAAWLAARLNSRIDVTNIVSKATQHPPGTVSLLLEGYTETLGPFEWAVSTNCSPYAPYRVFQLDSAEFGRLDTAGAKLAAGASLGATSLSVTTTSGPIWTTNAADFPFDINVGGWQVTVSNITGTGTTQTFTVSPLPAAVAINAVVKLWAPVALAI